MEKIKKYDYTESSTFVGMAEFADGGYVKLADYEKLEAELAELKHQRNQYVEAVYPGTSAEVIVRLDEMLKKEDTK